MDSSNTYFGHEDKKGVATKDPRLRGIRANNKQARDWMSILSPSFHVINFLGKRWLQNLGFVVSGRFHRSMNLALSDKQVARLREEIGSSEGIKKLIAEDDDFIGRLICLEMMESMVHVAKPVARIGNKCSDPSLKGFEHLFDEMIKIHADPYGWGFTWKKMDRKVKKMERFISVNSTLYQEMEMLSDLEQTVRRMKGCDPKPDNLPDYQKKLAWKQQEVRNLRRSHSGIRLMIIQQSVSALLQSSVHPSENSTLPRFSSGPLGNFTANSGPILKSNKNNFYSGPLGGSTTKSGPISGKNRNLNFFSGPLGGPTTKSGPVSGITKTGKKFWWTPQSPAFLGRRPPKPNRLTQVGPFKGCMVASNTSPVANCYLRSADVHSRNLEGAKESNADHLPLGSISRTGPSIFSLQHNLLQAIPETLGAAALALHYANVIVVIEKLAASPHLIGHDARDDLYNMLPAREKTEAAITELLVGLNYIWRLGRELNTKALQECASSRVFDEYLEGDLPPISVEKGISFSLPHRASSALLIKLLSNDL
ncbi:hypothetical protein OIU76_013002 [Salix suchowensis]|nr:hypothetical protein OIU76_013002 [Salix suchowensis]